MSARVRLRRRSALRTLTAASAMSMVGFAALTANPSAQATGTDFDVLSYSVSDQQIQFSLCLNTTSALPARVTITYDLTLDGVVVSSGSWPDDSTSTLVSVDPCPNPLKTVSIQGLLPGRAYAISAQMSALPQVEDTDGLYVDDGSRATVSSSANLNLTTTGTAATSGGGSGTDSGTSTPGTSTPGTSTPGTSTPGTSTTTSGSGSTGTTLVPVVIANPGSFTASQLLALSPAQVATIAAAVFGQLPPATFAALTAAQARALTLAQASSIRAARAAELTPRAVAALDPAAVAAMRPSAIKFLSPAAIGAMTNAQLKALTPRQIAAMRPKQLAALTVVEKSLLRRR